MIHTTLRALSGAALLGLSLACFTACGQSGNSSENTTTPEATPTATAAQEVPADMTATEVHDYVLSTEDDFVLLDVRTSAETDQGVLLGATILDYSQADFKEKLAEMDREQRFIVYCASGGRSGRTQQMMEELGFRQVTNMEGGITAWKAAGFPTVSPD